MVVTNGWLSAIYLAWLVYAVIRKRERKGRGATGLTTYSTGSGFGLEIAGRNGGMTEQREGGVVCK